MISSTVTTYSYTVPARTQSQADFNANMNNMFNYLGANLASEINTVSTEINSTVDDINTTAAEVEENAVTAVASASAALGNANATVYSGSATYSLYAAVIGTDGGTYRCMTNGTTGDNPVGSVTGNWLRLTFAEPTVNIKTTDFTVAADITYLVNSTAGTITATLPASPAAGQRVHLGDYAGTWPDNNVTLARNGNKIMSLSEDMTLNLNSFVTFIYIDTTIGWRLIK